MIDRFGAEHRKRLAVVLIAFFVILVLASSETVHAMIEGMLEFSEQWIHRHPGSGMVVFVVFSMFSAMLAFVSSALLVPIAIHAWGEVWTVLLLWTGWLLGGATAYGFGRYLGRPVMSWFVSVERLRAYEGRISRRAGFPVVLLFQLALPSEIPGSRSYFSSSLPCLRRSRVIFSARSGIDLRSISPRSHSASSHMR